MATVTKTFELKVNVEDQEVKELNATLEKTEGDVQGIEEAADKMSNGLVSGFKAGVKGVKSMITGLRTMKGALLATGLWAFVVVVSSLVQAFTSTEEGQNQLAKGMAVLGTVVDVFTDRLAAFGRGIIKLFTDPMGLFKDFASAIQSFVMDKVEKVVEGLGLMGSAISKLFKGDFAGALEDGSKGFVQLNRGLNIAVIATEGLINSTKELIKEITEEAKISAQIADQRAQA